MLSSGPECPKLDLIALRDPLARLREGPGKRTRKGKNGKKTGNYEGNCFKSFYKSFGEKTPLAVDPVL